MTFTLWRRRTGKNKEDNRDIAPNDCKFDLYSLVMQLIRKEESKVVNGELLLPCQVITSNPVFPISKDPWIDIVAVVDRGTTTNQKRPKPKVSRKGFSLYVHSVWTSLGQDWYYTVTENPFITSRKHTVTTLAVTLDEVKIFHVRGTPANGKTRLSELLRDYYRKEGEKVFLMTDWENLNLKDPCGSFVELV